MPRAAGLCSGGARTRSGRNGEPGRGAERRGVGRPGQEWGMGQGPGGWGGRVRLAVWEWGGQLNPGGRGRDTGWRMAGSRRPRPGGLASLGLGGVIQELGARLPSPLGARRWRRLWTSGPGLGCFPQTLVQTVKRTRPRLWDPRDWATRATTTLSRPPGLPKGGRVASIPRVLAAWMSWREEQGWGGRARSPRAHFPWHHKELLIGVWASECGLPRRFGTWGGES